MWKQEELDDILYAFVGGFALVFGIIAVFMVIGFIIQGISAIFGYL